MSYHYIELVGIDFMGKRREARSTHCQIVVPTAFAAIPELCFSVG